jgi:hypothetical protein
LIWDVESRSDAAFRSADEAGLALFTAAQQEDQRALLNVLGPSGKDVISPGDPAEDMNARVGFVVKYQQMHRLATESDGSTTLYVGDPLFWLGLGRDQPRRYAARAPKHPLDRTVRTEFGNRCR